MHIESCDLKGRRLNIPSTFRVWISSYDVAAVAQKGFRLVHAASDYFYLDCGAGGWVGNNPQGFVLNNIFFNTLTHFNWNYSNSWCEPFKTWQKAYSFEPTAGLTADQAKLVLGGMSSSSIFSPLCLTDLGTM